MDVRVRDTGTDVGLRCGDVRWEMGDVRWEM
jgi:hypothetical protein